MALAQDGSVWATGWNEYGQLGDGSTTNRRNFVKVISSGAMAMAAGYWHSMVLKADGTVWVTGQSFWGQLGDGTTVAKRRFIKVLKGQ